MVIDGKMVEGEEPHRKQNKMSSSRTLNTKNIQVVPAETRNKQLMTSYLRLKYMWGWTREA